MRRAVSRRDVLWLAAASGGVLCAPRLARSEPRDTGQEAAKMATKPMTTRLIPKTQEAVPVVGLGTWQAFDVDAARRAPQVEVVKQFLAAGGRVIDSSPMYGRAEAVVGDVLTDLSATGTPFFATKVWTRGKREGAAQMEQSRRRMHAERIDLMQIHNLLDWQTHLPVLREMKQARKIRYLGVTHYSHAEFPQIERLMRTEHLDFIQIPYNLADRAAEARVLPAAAETGTAVLVMRPFDEGGLFRRVKGKPLPGWAGELDCTSWAQLFLKFIISHPAVTCPIPATADPAHLADNIKAGFGRLPDAAQRRAMIATLEG
jgi:diketogulonate reductase-like aldo/keto reductase